MTWKFSDGTAVALGGDVEGASLFAQSIRESLADTPLIGLGPEPSVPVPLDTGDVLHMDLWLRQEMLKPAFAEMRLRVTDAPNVPKQPAAALEFDPDVVY